jgi:hypothetical protein
VSRGCGLGWVLTLRLDVSLPLNGSIDRSSPSWSTNLLNEYTTTINIFNKVSFASPFRADAVTDGAVQQRSRLQYRQ